MQKFIYLLKHTYYQKVSKVKVFLLTLISFLGLFFVGIVLQKKKIKIKVKERRRISISFGNFQPDI